MAERRYLSIGEVLGLLLEEFPDVTISKIRFLESQGLIDPERTPSGYRKFYDVDVERLRVILREQRENFLPLKVIKDRLDSGELPSEPTPTGGIRLPRPRGAAWYENSRADDTTGHLPRLSSTDGAPERHPAAGPGPTPAPPPPPVLRPLPPPAEPTPTGGTPRPGPSVPADGVGEDELCRVAGVDRGFLAELESYGLVHSRLVARTRMFDADAVQVVIAAAGLCQRGLEPRHLRALRNTVDKEIGLIEQLVLPLLRQRNPKAHEQAAAVARDVDALGSELRDALRRAALRRLLG